MLGKSWGEQGGARTDTVIKLVLIFFISLLSFSVGTFVGKQFSDSQHKLASLETDFKSSGGEDRDEREMASIPPGNIDVKPDDALTDEDIAKLSEEFVEPKKNGEEKRDEKQAKAEDSNPEKAEPKKAESKVAVKPAHKEALKAVNEEDESEGIQPETAAQIQKVQKAAERVAKGEEPAPRPASKATTSEERRLPSSLPATVASGSIGKFTVQVSSYKTEEEAKKRAEALKAKGFSAFYVSAKVGAATWYRVSVGLFVTKAEAMEYRSKLMTEGNIASALVQKIVK